VYSLGPQISNIYLTSFPQQQRRNNHIQPSRTLFNFQATPQGIWLCYFQPHASTNSRESRNFNMQFSQIIASIMLGMAVMVAASPIAAEDLMAVKRQACDCPSSFQDFPLQISKLMVIKAVDVNGKRNVACGQPFPPFGSVFLNSLNFQDCRTYSHMYIDTRRPRFLNAEPHSGIPKMAI